MWDHPAVQAHVATLRAAGPRCWSRTTAPWPPASAARGGFPRWPTSWRRRSVSSGPGAISRATTCWSRPGPRASRSIPSATSSNRSSGRMGYALAAQAARRGAAVTLVSGPTHLAPPAGIRVVPVQTAEEMREAVLHAAEAATMVIKAAAVADYRPDRAADAEDQFQAGRAHARPRAQPRHPPGGRHAPGDRFLVGFAAETHDASRTRARQARRQGRRPPRRQRREPIRHRLRRRRQRGPPARPLGRRRRRCLVAPRPRWPTPSWTGSRSSGGPCASHETRLT